MSRKRRRSKAKADRAAPVTVRHADPAELRRLKGASLAEVRAVSVAERPTRRRRDPVQQDQSFAKAVRLMRILKSEAYKARPDRGKIDSLERKIDRLLRA
jgi:hypothetical protein